MRAQVRPHHIGFVIAVPTHFPRKCYHSVHARPPRLGQRRIGHFPHRQLHPRRWVCRQPPSGTRGGFSSQGYARLLATRTPGQGQWRRAALSSSVRPGSAHKITPTARGAAVVSSPGVRGINPIHGRPPPLGRHATTQPRTHILFTKGSRRWDWTYSTQSVATSGINVPPIFGRPGRNRLSPSFGRPNKKLTRVGREARIC
jgi:hypothetical protein